MNHRIQICTPTGTCTSFGTQGSADGQFSSPTGVAIDATGVAAVQALNAGETLTDTFDYAISDGNGGTDTATVSVVVSGIDDDE